MKPLLPIAIALLAISPSAHAVVIIEPTRTFTVGTDIEDIQDPTVSFLQTVSDSAIISLTKVEVGLTLVGRGSGGFAGEMFVSINKDLGATASLLNRVGVSGSDAIGQPYDGWDVTFSDGAANGDIHTSTLSSGIQSGIWQPDGRIFATDTARTLQLGVFNGGTGNGAWRLSLADLAAGGTMRLQSWSLTLTGDNGLAAVPEPAEIAGVIGFGLFAFAAWRRRKH
jgi:hypothetical protein